ncbi:MAG: hypothetical protein Q7T56_00670 [Nocardioidaceae bacterium]|nr:hypothetical protein [Nocardioidaceae bacterium]
MSETTGSFAPATPPSVDPATVRDQVPLDGTAEARVDWRLPAVTGDEAQVVEVVRYNVALEALARSEEDPRRVATWWGAFTTDGELDAQYSYAADRTPDRQTGPRRAWVAPPQQTGPGTYDVGVCLDVSRVEVAGTDGSSTARDRARAVTYTVVDTDRADESAAWRVSRAAGVSAAPPFDDGADEREACWDWATSGS